MNKTGKIIGASILLSIMSLLFFKPAQAYFLCNPAYFYDIYGKVKWYSIYCEEVDRPSSDSPSPTPEPTYTEVEPSPNPSPSQSFFSPEPSVLPSETSQPKIVVPSESNPPIIEPVVSPSITQDVNYVTLKNGVVLEEETAIAVALLQNPSELLKKVFTNPVQTLKALGSVGADLPPKKRKKAQQITFPVVIVGSIVSSTTNVLIRGRAK